MRMRIIIVVFTVILVFYLFQFVFNMLKKKEHFSTKYYDDVEEYQDAPKSTEDEYDMRISLLNEIDKLEIADSKLKGSIMESVFSDVTMKKLKDLSKEARTQEVKNIYQAALNQGRVAQEAPVVVKPSVSTTVKSMFENGPDLPDVKDYYENDSRNKANKALEKLDNAIDALKDMKDILKDRAEKEPYIPDVPVPPLPNENYEEDKPVIEGFENIREFAHFRF